MTKIKFGTDGWRAIIAKEYTVDNVKRVATATALWVKQHNKEKEGVVIGFDCRFAGKMFAEVTAQVLGSHGIKVYLGPKFVSTPMVSLGVVKHGAFAGVVITASHNPPSYNGFKLKSHFGGPTTPKNIAAVEALIPDAVPTMSLKTLKELKQEGLFESVDLEQLFYDEVASKFDLDAVLQSHVSCAYDAMYGAGQHIVKRVLPNVVNLHCEQNPSFNGQAPEPLHRNLGELSTLIKNNPSINCGFANDGDADRIGMYDENGDFVDSHHILLLLVHYLCHYKKMTGKVIVTFSVTEKVKQLCEHYGLPYQVTKIGFKYIAEIMSTENVLVGGEESGGIAAAGHIPERDGVWMALLLLEFMAKTGKTLKGLIQEVYDIVGSFSFERDDLHINNELKASIIENCKAGVYTEFGTYKVKKTEDVDGYKYHFGPNQWVMIRPSGTEPVLRVYAEAPTAKEVRDILDAARAVLLGKVEA